MVFASSFMAQFLDNIFVEIDFVEFCSIINFFARNRRISSCLKTHNKIKNESGKWIIKKYLKDINLDQTVEKYCYIFLTKRLILLRGQSFKHNLIKKKNSNYLFDWVLNWSVDRRGKVKDLARSWATYNCIRNIHDGGNILKLYIVE